MQRFVRSSLAAGFAATVVVAGGITVAPQAVASTPRSTTAAVSLAGFEEFEAPALDYDPTTLVLYAPVEQDGTWLESVSHPQGLIQQLGVQPPIYKAIVGSTAGTLMQVTPQVVMDLAAFGGYFNGAAAVVGQQMATAVRDTVTPAQWGGGKVLQDWRNVGGALNAMTIGIGATVDGTWVPSLRVAAFSIRNQIANDIAGRTPTSIGALPNYAAHYTPIAIAALPAYSNAYSTVGSCADCGCGKCDSELEAAPAKSARVKTVGSAVRFAAKAAATPKAAAAPKATAARTRSAKVVSRN